MKPKMFTTRDCRYCPSIKKFLRGKGVEYEEIDVTDDLSLIRPASEKSGMHTVPQVLFPNGTVVVGVNIAKLTKEIANL